MDRYLLGEDLGADPAPDVAEGREPEIQVRLRLFGVGDQDYRPRGVAAGYLRDRAGDVFGGVLVGHHDQVQDARPEARGTVLARAESAQLSLYLLDAHRTPAGGVPGLPDHGRRGAARLRLPRQRERS